MMGNRNKKYSADEIDVLYNRKLYCYLVNNNKNVRFAKKAMVKRSRTSAKKELRVAHD